MENCYFSGWGEANWSVCNDQSFLVPWGPSWPVAVAVDEDRAASASRSHSQAEKRRRDRINSQLATLRKLIPKSDKMDKAALLGSVIDHVKELKRKAAEVGKSLTVPSEVDEVSIESEVSEDQAVTMRASVCCEDRPEVLGELMRVVKGLRLSTDRAELASVGGRIKSVLVLSSKDKEAKICPTALKHSLTGVLNKIVVSSSSNCHPRSKRQRFFLPDSHFHL